MRSWRDGVTARQRGSERKASRVSRSASIEIGKEDMHFSAAHFTIFSATERENLHGHDFFVAATVTGPVDDGGLCFDYNALKTRLRALCERLDETVLLPAESPHLGIDAQTDRVTVAFADERLAFLPRDVKILPVRNITVEELSAWFVAQLTADDGFLALPIDSLHLRVSSGPGQWAGTTWQQAA